MEGVSRWTSNADLIDCSGDLKLRQQLSWTV